jgi:hypothetical protein
MRSAHNVHPEFGCFRQSPNLGRKAGFALAFIVFGSIGGASGVVVQMAGHEPHIDGRSVIATIPLNSGATLSTIVSPASPPVSAPDSRQDSASPSNSPQTAPLNAIATAVTASTREATTELPQQPVAASKKSERAVRSPKQRDQGWYDASAWRRYGHERPSSSW